MSRLNRPAKWAIGIVATIAVLGLIGVVGSFVYIHFIKDPAPEKLTLSSPTTSSGNSTTSAASNTPFSADGTWTPTNASKAGYRVKENLFGQSAEAVGRTNKVTGEMTIAGTTLTAANFSVDMTTVTSDDDRRDGHFNNDIMDTPDFPSSTFVLSSPVDFGSVPAEGTPVTAKATGKLTLRGKTRDVTLDLKADRTGGHIRVNGSFNIHFPDWGIPNPTMGPARVGDDGTLEFLIEFAKKT